MKYDQCNIQSVAKKWDGLMHCEPSHFQKWDGSSRPTEIRSDATEQDPDVVNSCSMPSLYKCPLENLVSPRSSMSRRTQAEYSMSCSAKNNSLPIIVGINECILLISCIYDSTQHPRCLVIESGSLFLTSFLQVFWSSRGSYILHFVIHTIFTHSFLPFQNHN